LEKDLKASGMNACSEETKALFACTKHPGEGKLRKMPLFACTKHPGEGKLRRMLARNTDENFLKNQFR
jgi:hypothetical protein